MMRDMEQILELSKLKYIAAFGGLIRANHTIDFEGILFKIKLDRLSNMGKTSAQSSGSKSLRWKIKHAK